MSRSKPSKSKTIAYWITTVMGPGSFIMGGTLFLTGAEEPKANMTALGFPAFLLYVLGFWKLTGAITSLIPGVPRLKEWAYAGFFFLLSSASALHALNGDPAVKIFPPLLFLAFTIASYQLRPASRRL